MKKIVNSIAKFVGLATASDINYLDRICGDQSHQIVSLEAELADARAELADLGTELTREIEEAMDAFEVNADCVQYLDRYIEDAIESVEVDCDNIQGLEEYVSCAIDQYMVHDLDTCVFADQIKEAVKETVDDLTKKVEHEVARLDELTASVNRIHCKAVETAVKLNVRITDNHASAVKGRDLNTSRIDNMSIRLTARVDGLDDKMAQTRTDAAKARIAHKHLEASLDRECDYAKGEINKLTNEVRSRCDALDLRIDQPEQGVTMDAMIESLEDKDSDTVCN